jgi:uncharacterized protein (DUF58 family)
MRNRLIQFLRVVRPAEGGESIITGRKIYILPTRYGLVFGILLITLLIASINYANNPAFILTFLLTGVFIQAIFHTWRNLLGLHVSWQHGDPVFAGETSFFHFQLHDPKGRAHYTIQLGFHDQEAVVVACADQHKTPVKIPFLSKRRGRLQPGRLTLETRFPLGLLRAWCYMDTAAEAIIWPRPAEGRLEQTDPVNEGSRDGDRGVGTDDFVGYRGYRPGDSLSHISWKALAGEKGLLVKQFGGDRVNQLWLDFDALPDQPVELRLSILAGAVQELSSQPVHYGLRLGEQEIRPGDGENQRLRCLQALALYGEPR